jgi:predicted ATPase/signal transduction histidine kinase
LKQLIIDTFDIREDTEPSETDLCDDLEFEQSDTDPADLAKLVYDKTHGNPFFSVSFITNLYREGMISFNLARGQWQWFTHKIAGADISDNVVHMMTNRIKKLSHETRDVLCLAASIGSRFDFGLLSLVHGGDKQECATALWSAIKDGLIVQLGGSPFEDVWLNKHELLGGDLERNNFMQFLHDRVHQAAYELMDEEERVQTHLKIGRVMLTAFNERELDDNLFDLVTHFKHGAELITDTKERYHLAELAVQAGRRSRVSAAYSSGLDFLVFGLTMMRGFGEEEMWQEKYYHLSLELHLLLCQMYYLLGRFDDSSKLYPYIESKCQNDLDIIKVKSVQVAQFEIVQDYAGCVNTNMLSLRMLGLEMPDMDDMSRVKQVLKEGQEQIYVNLQGRKISSLVDQKRMTDPNDIAIMRCLISMWASFFCLGYSEHTGLTCVYIVNQSLLKGNCEYTAPGFACYSFSAGQFNGDYESAYEFGKVGMTLAFKDGGGRGSEMSKCYLGYPAGSHNWCQPISEGVANLKRGFDVAVESGDFAFAAYLSHHVVTDMFFDNEPLSDVFRAHQKYMSFLKKNNEFIYAFAQMATRPARALWVPRAGSWAINSIVEHHDMEPDMWRELHKGAVYETIYHYSSVIEAFYFENSQNWIQIADDCFDNVSLPLLGSCKVAEVVFVTGMIYMGHDYNDDASISEKHKEQCMDRTEQCISRFREWARLCPRNWSHKLYLLLGEKARISGDRAEALNLYEQALEVARSNQQKHGEAIAHETLGKFWLHAAKGVVHNNYARFHFDEAVSIYEEWGANGKADWMRKRYNRILTPNPHSPRIPMIIQVSNETHTVASSESGSLHRLSGSSGSTASRELHSSSSDSVAAYSSDDDVELMISPSLVSTPSSTSEQKKKITEQNNSAIDLLTFMKMDQLTEGQQSLTGFLNQMMRIVLQNTGATKGVFLQADKDNQLTVVAECDSSDLQSDVLRAVSLDSFENVSKSVVYYTARKKENVLVNDATKKKQDPLQFDATTDPYIQSHGIKSILCIPIVKLSEFKGVLYLENNLIPNAFLNQRVKVVTMLASHIALSLNEARFEQVLQSEKELKRVATELSIVKKRLEEFIDVLCHELRNPLHAIIGNKDIIADNLEAMRQRLETLDTNAHTPKFMKDKINECQESVAAMTISSDHLKDIVDTVLTVSMLEDQSSNLQVIPFTPANIIDMIAIMFKATVSDKGLTLRTEFQNEQIKTITVLGDLYRFKEVIINLVSNAIKFTDRGGSVTIKMSKESEDGEKVTLMFQVQDTGIGIKQEEIPRLFQKFGQANAQTYNKYGGSGLGLKISKEIVELMGGSQLQLESTYGEGSTFYFSVPFTVYVEGDMKPEMGPLDPLNVNALSGTKHRLYRSFTKIDFHEDLTPTRSSPSTIELKKEKKSVAPRKPSPTDIGKILVVEDNGIVSVSSYVTNLC